MCKSTLCSVLAATLVIGAMALPATAQNRMVNMVPNNRSGETNQDAEPTITVDPNNYNRIAGSAFTWDNLAGTPMTTATAPIFVSTDRGATWTLAFIVPSKVGAGFPTGDINISFGATLSGAVAHETSWLYGGTLSSTVASRPMTVLRAQDPFSATLMATLSTRTGNVDQPHAKALSELWSGADKLYVGFNNGFGSLIGGVCVGSIPSGRTATLDVSQDAKVAAPAMTLDLIEARNTACQDGFAQVPAPHLDGTVYAAFISNWSSSPRVVVVRDDNWGLGATPFSALTDPSDSVAGRFVTPALTLPSGFMGQNRLGASNVAIAVDPRNSDRVYVAWGDSGGANSETIHVRRSINRGVDWSAADLLNVTSAMNPQVAINSLGTVGVLYQRVVSGRWETHLVRTTDADATTFDTPGILLANQSATTPGSTYSPYIGDYASLVSAGKNFIGMFSTSNFPDTANFLPGVQFQREVDWGTHKLFTDATHTTEVSTSIDPFFFEIETVSSQNDFYVRDWTTDATHADNGVEPSTSSNFYSYSDVWNRRSTPPGPFVSDQPSNEDAGNGDLTVGDNWAFARVRRNAAGPVTNVTAHFLVSRFGTGSNFVDATTGDPAVTFPDPDPVITTDGSSGPWISSAHHWHLDATASTHLCLAVQISAPGDPYITPSLVGNTPGWSTGTDLRILNDNNKAQRNMHLTTIPASGGVGSVTEWAIVHNPGFTKRDIPLRISINGISKRYIRGLTVQTIGGERPVTLKAQDGSSFVLRDVQPGENRWVAVNVQTVGLPTGATAFTGIDELAGGKPASGFAVGVRSASLQEAIKDSLFAQRAELTRLESFFAPENRVLDDEYFKAAAVPPSSNFVDFVQGRLLPRLKEGLDKVGVPVPGDSFNLRASFAAVEKEKSAPAIVTTLASLLNGIDAQLNQMQLEKGDPADIMQMVHWQKQLYRQQSNLKKLSCADDLVAASTEFLSGRESGKLTNADYPWLLNRVSQCLVEGVDAQGGKIGIQHPFESTDLALLEKDHRAFLLVLAR